MATNAGKIEEVLVVAHLSDLSCTMAELSRQRWFGGRERACRLALERLRESGQVACSKGWWHVVCAEPYATARQVQRSLF
jgi:hypothetical protein